MTGYNLTRLWMGDYYRTYPGITTEDEVRAALATDADFDPGPRGTKRDSMEATQHGFVEKRLLNLPIIWWRPDSQASDR